eukprot:TRINITY_DN14191_c0_g2_i5.p1 TRINITY_DN14191_c0_g2~~TRINITY_DN14191_c0_g2_i5.p1  ORF type:complete len:321 (-),score=51.45 TRINITY_DN14191_c0_g2_i5:29-991(-)
MKNESTLFPVLKVEGNNTEGVNRLYIKREKLFVARVNGVLSIVDISTKQIQSAYNNYFLLHKNSPIFPYREVTNRLEVMPQRITAFLEIHDLAQIDSTAQDNRFSVPGLEEGDDSRSFCEDNIGIAGSDNSLLIFSLLTFNIVHRYKAHESKVVGVYVNDVANNLLVITKNGTVYVYSMASCMLERKVRAVTAWDIFDLSERSSKLMTKGDLKYKDIFKMYTRKEITLKKGCHKAMDFCNMMEGVQTNWRNPSANSKAIHRTVFYETTKGRKIEKVIEKEKLQIKVFNNIVNLEGKLNINKEYTIGYTSIRIRLGLLRDH